MRVDVRLCPVLGLRCPIGAGPREFDEGTTVSVAAVATGVPVETRFIAFVNDRRAAADTLLCDGDRLYLFVPVSGG